MKAGDMIAVGGGIAGGSAFVAGHWLCAIALIALAVVASALALAVDAARSGEVPRG